MARKIPQNWFDWVAALVNREPDRAKRRVEARREWNRRYPEMPVPLDRPLVAPREPVPGCGNHPPFLDDVMAVYDALDDELKRQLAENLMFGDDGRFIDLSAEKRDIARAYAEDVRRHERDRAAYHAYQKRQIEREREAPFTPTSAMRRAEAKGAASLLLADMGIPVRKGDRR